MNTGCGCHNGISGAAFALVLFILLVIILGAFI
ncbi:MAG: sporulation protein YjcZ [Bacilli bacterium]